MIRFSCPECGKHLRVDERHAGRSAKCPSCGQTVQAPPPGEAPSEQAEQAPPRTEDAENLEALAAAAAARDDPQPSLAPHTAPTARTSGLAVTALILGLCGLVVPLVGIVGIIVGIRAIRQVSKPENGLSGKGMAITGTVLGSLSMVNVTLVTLLIVAVLVSANDKRPTELRKQCAKNMFNLWQACWEYTYAHDGRFPPNLGVLIRTGAIEPRDIFCPASDDQPDHIPPPRRLDPKWVHEHSDYLYLAAGATRDEISRDRVVMLELASNHDFAGIHVLRADGTVAFLPPRQALQLLRRQKIGQRQASEQGRPSEHHRRATEQRHPLERGQTKELEHATQQPRTIERGKVHRQRSTRRRQRMTKQPQPTHHPQPTQQPQEARKGRHWLSRHRCAANMRVLWMTMRHAAFRMKRFPPHLAALLRAPSVRPRDLLCPATENPPKPITVPRQGIPTWVREHSDYIYLSPRRNGRARPSLPHGIGRTMPPPPLGFGGRTPPRRIVLYEPLANHGGAGMNILFASGRVQFLPADQALKLLRSQGVEHPFQRESVPKAQKKPPVTHRRKP